MNIENSKLWISLLYSGKKELISIWIVRVWIVSAVFLNVLFSVKFSILFHLIECRSVFGKTRAHKYMCWEMTPCTCPDIWCDIITTWFTLSSFRGVSAIKTIDFLTWIIYMMHKGMHIEVIFLYPLRELYNTYECAWFRFFLRIDSVLRWIEDRTPQMTLTQCLFKVEPSSATLA